MTPAPPAQPVVFEQDGRPLFGWYHPPAVHDGHSRDCVVVMCNPLGYDAICTHRHYRVLAQQLAGSGFAVLRYDHDGTGDSAGSDEDPQRLQAWINGIACAVEYGKQRSGARQVSLFGVRMGGTLALAAAAAAPLADSLVAWSAFASGALYLREMRALRMLRDADVSTAAVMHDAGADVGEEAAGYLLTASTVAALSTLSPVTATAAPVASVLLLARDDLPESDRLARHLTKTGCTVTQIKVPGYAGMMRDTFDAIVPLTALTEIRSWLVARYPLQVTAPAKPVNAAASLTTGHRGVEASVRETAVRFGPASHLFGIVSEPLHPQAGRAGTAIIFVSVGSNHHIGPNRMYVSNARALAALGFMSLRMDIGGVGESPPGDGQRENHLYALHSAADVKAAMQFLRTQYGTQQIILAGVCSGAYLSFHAAIDEPGVSSIVLINPQTFIWHEGDSLQLRSQGAIRSMDFYRSNLLNAGTWRRLVTGEINFFLIVAGVAAMLKKRLALRWSALLRLRFGARAEAAPLDVKNTFQNFLRREVNVFLIYSAADGGINEMETHLGPDAAALRKHARFKLQIVEGADHTFTPLWAQRRLLDLLTQHLIRLYG